MAKSKDFVAMYGLILDWVEYRTHQVVIFWAKLFLGMKFHPLPHNVGSAAVGYGNGFARTTTPITTISLIRQSASPESHFVDLGCGDGVVLLLAQIAGLKRICGVEMDPELSAMSKSNVRRACIHTGDMESSETLSHLDSLENPLIFAFNPSSSKVVANAISQIIENAGHAQILLRNADNAIEAIMQQSPRHQFQIVKKRRNHTLLTAVQIEVGVFNENLD